MATLRGITTVWDATSGVGVDQNDASGWAYVGSATNVAVFIKSAASVTGTFKIQATGVAGNAGRNEIDGGEEAYDYHAGLTEISSLSVAAGGLECFNLSPFAPQFVRLIRTDANGVDDFEATVVSNGVN